jgi:hypothetical protein
LRQYLAALGLAAGTLIFTTAPAQAQNSQSWVASTGSDLNACTRASPCRNMARAISQANTGGQINCVDRLELAPFTIGKSITIDCEPGGTVTTSGSLNAIAISPPATAVVHLRGLHLESRTATGIGIRVTSGTIFVDNLAIRDFNIIGLAVTGVQSRVFVTDTVITGNSIGIGVQASVSNVDMDLVLTRVVVEGSTSSGLRINRIPANQTGSIRFKVRDSSFSGNADGIAATNTASATTAVSIVLQGVEVARNGGAGMSVDEFTQIVASDSRIIGNGTGLSASGGGAIVSAGGNLLAGNGTDGAFSGTIARQ